MKQFTYVIQDPVGIHGRTALALVEQVRGLDSRVIIAKGGVEVEATRMMALMTMGIVQGDQIAVTVQGDSEEEDCRVVEQFFKDHL